MNLRLILIIYINLVFLPSLNNTLGFGDFFQK